MSDICILKTADWKLASAYCQLSIFMSAPRARVILGACLAVGLCIYLKYIHH